MIYSQVIIIGGGPAGSTCGWRLKQNGIECLILDKQKFPRAKLCAGWIQPQVIDELKLDANDYPHSLTTFKTFQVHIFNRELEIKVYQHAIRRYEFDNWLLKRSGVKVYYHNVENIKKDSDYFIIDDQYCCKHLVGAGGTHCPVYQTFFRQLNLRSKTSLVVTLEEEFPYDSRDANCHLWFFQNKLPGYSWYVPKNNGYLNIGIGGFAEKLKTNNDSIQNQWQIFIKELEQRSLVKNHLFHPGGYVYYLRNSGDKVQIENLLLVGDAAGLATKDMGEGIGPAVRSGILAAEAIISGKQFSVRSIQKYSFPRHQTALKLLAKYFTTPRPKKSHR